MWLSVLKSFLQAWLILKHWMHLIVYLDLVWLIDLIWVMMLESSMWEVLTVVWWNWNDWNEIKVSWLYKSLYALVWLNYYVMCDDWVIDLYVIILVKMKLVYWAW